jgi:hypothetical protein
MIEWLKSLPREDFEREKRIALDNLYKIYFHTQNEHFAQELRNVAAA